MANAHIEYDGVPHVYTALANILKSLSVEKNGVLPGNMGGKPYITAVDAAAETKRQFVANNLIFLPDEEVVKHETIIHKDRLNIAIVIKGTYTIISTVDGSRVVVSGTGDGLATGTAVASNIGSTNALKNALLRTFLITEQSVEDASKAGVPDEATSPTQRRLDAARKGPAKPPAGGSGVSRPAAGSGGSARDKIRVEYIESGKVEREVVNRMHQEAKDSGLSGDEAFEAVLKRLEKGEVS